MTIRHKIKLSDHQLTNIFDEENFKIAILEKHLSQNIEALSMNFCSSLEIDNAMVVGVIGHIGVSMRNFWDDGVVK